MGAAWGVTAGDAWGCSGAVPTPQGVDGGAEPLRDAMGGPPPAAGVLVPTVSNAGGSGVLLLGGER